MDVTKLTALSESGWQLAPQAGMRVPAVIFGNARLVAEMDDKGLEQILNVARLPGIVGAAYVMPDAHWGYGFPIGGVAAFDPEAGGVISAGGVGFDCGVRTLLTHLRREEIVRVQRDLADNLFRNIPAGVGSTGKIVLDSGQVASALSRRDQLRLRQSPNPDPSDTQSVPPLFPRGQSRPALRGVPQYVQGGDSRDRWKAAPSLRSSQGRGARLRPWARRSARRFRRIGPARSYRWQH